MTTPKTLRALTLAALLPFTLSAHAVSAEDVENALQKTLTQFQKQTLVVKPREDLRCKADKTYHQEFAGLAEVAGYYYLFAHFADLPIPYFNERATPADIFLVRTPQKTLKKYIAAAAQKVKGKQKENILQFALALQKSYSGFKAKLTPETLEKMSGFSDDIFAIDEHFLDIKGTIGVSRNIDGLCRSEWLTTGDVINPLLYNEDTYFSFYGLESYYYSFWWRRYKFGTLKESKALLDYAVTQLQK